MSTKYPHHPLSQRSSSELSKETLLEKDDHDYDVQLPSRKAWRLWVLALVLQSVLIAIYTITYLTSIQKARQQIVDTLEGIDSPALSSIENTQTIFEYRSSTMDAWFGYPPTDTIDDRWDTVLEHGSFKFSPEEMARWGLEKGVLLSDNSGYYGTLNVFHELHCLKRIYMYIHKKEYFDPMNLTAYQEEANLRHIMHCLDGLRQGIQCRVDVTPVAFYWSPIAKLPLANWATPHQCRNWDSFFSWAKKNSFDPFQPGLVVHPQYGESYGGEEDVARKLGILLKDERDDA